MDWWQFLYSFVGGFLGFGFALLSEALVNHVKNINNLKELNNNIIDELKSIADNLRGNETKRVPIYFETPIWRSITSTGIIMSLLAEDKETYDNIILIYNRIYALKEMEKDITKNHLDISIIRKEIVEKIEKITS